MQTCWGWKDEKPEGRYPQPSSPVPCSITADDLTVRPGPQLHFSPLHQEPFAEAHPVTANCAFQCPVHPVTVKRATQHPAYPFPASQSHVLDSPQRFSAEAAGLLQSSPTFWRLCSTSSRKPSKLSLPTVTSTLHIFLLAPGLPGRCKQM